MHIKAWWKEMNSMPSKNVQSGINVLLVLVEGTGKCGVVLQA